MNFVLSRGSHGLVAVFQQDALRVSSNATLSSAPMAMSDKPAVLKKVSASRL